MTGGLDLGQNQRSSRSFIMGGMLAALDVADEDLPRRPKRGTTFYSFSGWIELLDNEWRNYERELH